MELRLEAPCLLIASPDLLDSNFERTVVLLFEHSDLGSAGLVLNRPLEFTVGQVVKEGESYASLQHQHVFQGGPVSLDTASVLFLADSPCEEACTIKDRLQLTGSTAALRRLFRPGSAAPPSRFLMGYAGWSRGQLVTEIEANAWFLLDLDADEALTTPPEALWERSLERLGISRSNLVIPGDGTVN